MKLRIFILSTVMVLVFACKKKEENQETPAPIKCRLSFTESTDTNYIPHNNSNKFNYCNGSNTWVANVTGYKKTGKTVEFGLLYVASKFGTGPFEQYTIDSLGNYRVNMHYLYGSTYDSLLIINPKANTGDTIYKNYSKKIFVVLVDKNYTFSKDGLDVAGCYHSRIIYKDGTTEDNFYKKGVGLLYWPGTGGAILNNS